MGGIATQLWKEKFERREPRLCRISNPNQYLLLKLFNYYFLLYGVVGEALLSGMMPRLDFNNRCHCSYFIMYGYWNRALV